MGSSPLTRGKQGPRPPHAGGAGLIPAHAGKTRAESCRGDPGGAHPRSRGENRDCGTKRRGSAGSSPLTRGKLCARERDADGGGLIPAHAGKTEANVEYLHEQGAHPRSRGENNVLVAPVSSLDGSSPLTRGKLARGLAGGRSRRLIPAHAGKTQVRLRACCERPAHPRSRGENLHSRAGHVVLTGSSPLTRGKLR